MTQDDYKLWTGSAVSFTEEDWQRLVSVASSRLASLLCLEVLPAPLPDDLGFLLANFINGVLRYRGTPESSVQSKQVRNFSITFSTSTITDVFNNIMKNYADIVDKYSRCGCSLKVEKSAPDCDCRTWRIG